MGFHSSGTIMNTIINTPDYLEVRTRKHRFKYKQLAEGDMMFGGIQLLKVK